MKCNMYVYQSVAVIIISVAVLSLYYICSLLFMNLQYSCFIVKSILVVIGHY